MFRGSSNNKNKNAIVVPKSKNNINQSNNNSISKIKPNSDYEEIRNIVCDNNEGIMQVNNNNKINKFNIV